MRGMRAGKESAEGVVRLWTSGGDIGRHENLRSLFARVAARQEPKDSALGESHFLSRLQPKNLLECSRLLLMCRLASWFCESDQATLEAVCRQSGLSPF